MDDLIDDAGEELPSAAEMIKMRREMREAELAAARDSEPNPEELEKYIKERFGGRRWVPLGAYGRRQRALCRVWRGAEKQGANTRREIEEWHVCGEA